MIISYGVMSRDYKVLSAIPWNLVVLDEGHYITNGKTQRTRAALSLRDKSKCRMLLTGTPMPNKVGDLYSQLEFLGKGFSGFRSKKEFDNYYQQTNDYYDGSGNQRTEVIGLQNVPILQERLARMSFIIRKADALPDLPEKMYDVVGVDMTTEQRRVYRNALQSVLVEAENELGGMAGDGRNYQMTLQNVLKKMLRLSQITSGFFVSDALYDDDGETIMNGEMHRFDPNPKIEALVELVKNKPRTSKTIIWCCWKQDIRSITARLKLEGLDYVSMHGETPQDERERIKHRFNTDDTCRGLVGGSASGGVGVNLLGHSSPDTNCDHVIYFSQNFSSPVRSQSEDRPHRLGTRVPVLYTDLVVPGTIDQEIREAVVLKRTKSYQVQDVRRLLERLAAG